MKIYITRHGQTEWNVLKKLQGRADIELNDKGREQARITKQVLDNIEFDLIICSPLKRAKETAEIINKDRNIPIIYDDRIAERKFGEFEGLYKSDFDFDGFWSYKRNYKYKEAENIEEFFNRIYSFIDSIKKEYKDKRILIVAHGGVSIPFDCYFNGIPDMDCLLPLCLENCEVKEYELC